MYPPTHKSLVRPRSSLSTTDENRLKPGLNATRCRPSLTVLTLIGACAFLFVLCVCLVCALVLVGKNFARAGVGGNGSANSVIHLAATDIDGDRLSSSVIAASESGAIPQVEHAAGEQASISRIPKAVDNIDSNDLIPATLIASDWHKSVLSSRQKVVYRPSKLHFSVAGGESDSAVNIGGIPLRVSSPSSAVVESSMTVSMSKVIPKLTFRLPKFIKPRLYNLWLEPNLDTKRFTGKVSIELDILSATSFIPLHSKWLNVTSTNVFRMQKDGASVPVKVSHAFAYEQLEYWVTEFEKPIEPATYQMKLSFEGSLTDRIVGFYQSSYFDKKTKTTRWIATSKFEPTFARQAFPCFDEPAMKAQFKVTLTYPNTGDYHALSNMDIESTLPEGNDKMIRVFNQSVPMSTYLACFIVSDFVSKRMTIQAAVGNNFFMDVYAAPDQLSKVDFALETGVGVTEYYIDFFQIEYPLPKLDMVAIPDFVSGAMEHWGLVTFRETALLYHPDFSSAINKQRVASTVSHELAHMWFGNLVTMKWWNDLWLNEGFATYITYKGLNAVYSDWGMLHQFLVNDLHGVLQLDSTLASHPIVQPAENPDQITELFDTITYSKGASVIRMLEGFVGEATFKQSVTNYLTKFRYSNAVTDDFLTEVDNLVDGLDVKHVMDTFTLQMGFPVVEVKKLANNQYRLTQKRFFSNPSDEKVSHEDSPFNYRWCIPITYFTNENSTEVKSRWFVNTVTELLIDDVPSTAKWVKFNKDQIGYYRVNYEREVWQDLAMSLDQNVNSMSISDRGHLLNDVQALADAKQLDYDIAFDFMNYLKHENEFVPWSVASSALLTLRNRLRRVDYYQMYMKFAQDLVKDIYEEVGWVPNENNHLQNRLRIVILETACALDYKPCVEEAVRRFNVWMNDPTVRPVPDIRTLVYSQGVAAIQDEADWSKVWELFLDETDANEKAKLMSALASVKIPFILQKYIDLAWDENNVRQQDYFTCMQSIAANPMGEPLVWDYVRENWPQMVTRFGLNERYLGRMIPSITGRFASQIKLEEMDTFFTKYPEAGAGAAARKQAIENVRNNIQWLEGNKAIIGQWLKNKLYASNAV